MTPQQALWFSIGAATATIVFKWGAWWITGSVGLLSDALDSVTNLVAGSFALIMVVYARRPANSRFQFGYGKAEYFSATSEGLLVVLAGATVLVAAIPRLFDPHVVHSLGIGATLSLASAALNFLVARILIQVGRDHRSPATEGDGQHLLSDVYVTVGVLVGVGLSALTGWRWLDPAVAILMGLNLIRQGIGMFAGALSGLMDGTFAEKEVQQVRDGLAKLELTGSRFLNLRTRRGGAHRFALVELQVPADWTVERADQLARSAEAEAIAHGIRLAVRITAAATADSPHGPVLPGWRESD
jgi:cation diffusion facilitator family transporter